MSEEAESTQPERRRALRWIGGILIVAAIVALVRVLPLAAWLEAFERWVRARGALGIAVYGLVYVAATLLLVPGSALTLVGGALFGPFVGTAVVSLASTAAAGAAFLIARHLARVRVRELARRHPRFEAVDRAVAEGGWRIVFLLRLSPAVPFSASNYLYGLTAVRFVPYLLASWIAMLPGTALVVYLGHASAEGLSAVGEAGERERTPAEWLLLGAGLVATLVVTFYVTRLARRALSGGDVCAEHAP